MRSWWWDRGAGPWIRLFLGEAHGQLRDVDRVDQNVREIRVDQRFAQPVSLPSSRVSLTSSTIFRLFGGRFRSM